MTIQEKIADLRDLIAVYEKNAKVAFAFHDDQAEAYLMYEEIAKLEAEIRELESQLSVANVL
jgi:accessory colonization factor AcfC